MRILIAAALLALAGCASVPGVFSDIPRPPFPVEEYAQLSREGTGTVIGQAFLRTMGGEVRYGAGSEVMLNPVTSYSTFWYEQDYSLGGRRLAPPDPRLEDYILTTQADGDGRFAFRNVPPGDYYAVSRVDWHVARSYGLTQEGGWIARRITVKDDETTEVMLTR